VETSSEALTAPLGARRGISAWTDRHIRLLLVAPVVLLIVLLSIFPLGYSLWVSFVHFDFRVPGHPWNDAANYVFVIKNGVAQASLWRSVALASVVVTVELGLGLALALAVVRPFRGRRLLIPILLLPLFMAPVVVGQLWRMLWDPQFGPVNYILSLIWPGDVNIVWAFQYPWNWVSIVVTDAWQWTPFMFVILLAGLSAIPEDVYEAASLDGASKLQTLVGVTLPLLLPIIIVAVAFRLIDALKIFDAIFVLTGGGPGTSTYTESFYLYEQGFRLFNFGQASAGSWIFLVIVSVISYWLVRRLLEERAA
jgi:multiple sugar transport system permease protein